MARLLILKICEAACAAAARAKPNASASANARSNGCFMAFSPVGYSDDSKAMQRLRVYLALLSLMPLTTLMFSNAAGDRSGEALGLRITANQLTLWSGLAMFGSIGWAFGRAAVFWANADAGNRGSLSRSNDTNGNTPHN